MFCSAGTHVQGRTLEEKAQHCLQDGQTFTLGTTKEEFQLSLPRGMSPARPCPHHHLYGLASHEVRDC